MSESWGFCSRDCFLGESPKNTLRALEEGVDILDDFLCDKFVDASIRQRVAGTNKLTIILMFENNILVDNILVVQNITLK